MNVWAALWTALAVIGWTLSLHLIFEAIRDLSALGLIANGRRKRIWARLASEAIRVVIHSAFIAVGVPALGSDFELTPFVATMIGVAALLIVKSLISLYVTTLEPSRATQEEAAARDLIATARAAAAEIVAVAEVAARHLKEAEVSEPIEERKAEAAERTADATERIADQQDSNGASV